LNAIVRIDSENFRLYMVDERIGDFDRFEQKKPEENSQCGM